MATGRYVTGTQKAYPWGKRDVSGPFDEFDEAWQEMKRLTPLYPDAILSVTTKRAASLPVATPRTRPPGDEPDDTTYDLAEPDDRLRAARAIAGHAVAFGADAMLDEWEGDYDLDIATPSLRAKVRVQKGPVPGISWYAAAFPLREHVPGAWHEIGWRGMAVSERRAVSEPTTWPELFDALETGICAAIDGSAFVLEETGP